MVERAMVDFPVSYDPESQSVRLEGPGGATILLNLVYAAKFNEPLNPDLLFNPGVARLLRDLRGGSYRPEKLTAAPLSSSQLVTIARLLLEKADELGWWSMEQADQMLLLQDVVAAPHQFSEEQIETIKDELQAGLWRLRRIVEAAPTDQGV